MHIFAYQNHSTLRHMLFHRSSKRSLSLFTEPISLIYDQNLKFFRCFCIYFVSRRNILYNFLDDVPIIILIVCWRNLYMKIAAN